MTSNHRLKWNGLPGERSNSVVPWKPPHRQFPVEPGAEFLDVRALRSARKIAEDISDLIPDEVAPDGEDTGACLAEVLLQPL